MNNWYVVAGAPHSGKTSIINALEERGFFVVEEAARSLINEQLKAGNTLEEIRADEMAFTQLVTERIFSREVDLLPETITFLDRGIPDILPYLRLYDVPIDPELEQRVRSSRYRKIFILDPLAYEKDYSRVEDSDQAARLNELVNEVYHEYNFPVANVPIMPIEDRVDFILKHIET